MKAKFLIVSLTSFIVSSLLVMTASANGVREGQNITSQFAEALQGHTLLCANSAMRVVFEANKVYGGLRMIATSLTAGGGAMDTNNERQGEECGGLFANYNAAQEVFVFDDVSDDCERGKSDYAVIFSANTLTLIANRESFVARSRGGARDADGPMGALSCAVR